MAHIKLFYLVFSPSNKSDFEKTTTDSKDAKIYLNLIVSNPGYLFLIHSLLSHPPEDNKWEIFTVYLFNTVFSLSPLNPHVKRLFWM